MIYGHVARLPSVLSAQMKRLIIRNGRLKIKLSPYLRLGDIGGLRIVKFYFYRAADRHCRKFSNNRRFASFIVGIYFSKIALGRRLHRTITNIVWVLCAHWRGHLTRPTLHPQSASNYCVSVWVFAFAGVT